MADQASPRYHPAASTATLSTILFSKLPRKVDYFVNQKFGRSWITLLDG
jgi:hypothetical protein